MEPQAKKPYKVLLESVIEPQKNLQLTVCCYPFLCGFRPTYEFRAPTTPKRLLDIHLSPLEFQTSLSNAGSYQYSVKSKSLLYPYDLHSRFVTSLADTSKGETQVRCTDQSGEHIISSDACRPSL